ncbi:hypothetical protein BRADI_3g41866v3 [Brachypodium distachyon]|uniref:Uncharacterized protein n=1 Tax=Brachypodium distachyon TaxID=15368 RepID=A0A0Q3E0J6_BRADI|nr:hypothetical protein BRADI_3g41866v3 [Brachypodium distachyon]
MCRIEAPPPQRVSVAVCAHPLFVGPPLSPFVQLREDRLRAPGQRHRRSRSRKATPSRSPAPCLRREAETSAADLKSCLPWRTPCPARAILIVRSPSLFCSLSPCRPIPPPQSKKRFSYFQFGVLELKKPLCRYRKQDKTKNLEEEEEET